MLNVVNFGGGAYVIYAEVTPTGEIEVDLEPYSDTFDRPARLLPIEGNALVAAIDLIGLAHADLRVGAREGRRRARVRPGRGGPAHRLARASTTTSCTRSSSAMHEHRLLELEYWTQSEDRYSERDVEPYALINSREGWYVAAWDLERGQLRHFRLDRIKDAPGRWTRRSSRAKGSNPAADIGGWPRTGRIGGSRSARVKVSAEQARWAREQRTVLTELEGGEIVVEITFKGLDFLVREVLKEAGDAVVLEPADAREAVLVAAEGLIARAT